MNARVAYDNRLRPILINGQPANQFFLQGANPPWSGYSAAVSLNGAWRKGLNTIDFLVGEGPTNSSEGLRAQLSFNYFLAIRPPFGSSILVTNMQTVSYMNLIGATTNQVFSVTGARNGSVSRRTSLPIRIIWWCNSSPARICPAWISTMSFSKTPAPFS